MSQQNPTQPQTDDDDLPKSRTSFGGFLLPVVGVVALGAGGLFLYKGRVTTNAEIADLNGKARDKLERHDLSSLREAEALFKQMTELDSSSPDGWIGLAAVNYFQTDHGLNTLDQAAQALEKAKDLGSESPYRYAVDGYVRSKKGQGADVERELKAMLDAGQFHPVMAHAMGLAVESQGRHLDANRFIKQAAEARFSAVAFPLSLAEIAHRQGDERGAARQLDGIVRDTMAPNHYVARAMLAALRLKNQGKLAGPAAHIKTVQDALAADPNKVGPRAEGLLAWAEGELALALGNAGGALEKADSVAGKLGDFPPAMDLKARAYLAQKKPAEALAAYDAAMKLTPEYRGIKWAYARLKSEQKDDSALALVEELEKSAPYKTPEYEVFRGEHMLRMGKIDAAKEAFERAAELGDDPAILFGLAKVTFEKEKGRGNKADIERVAEAVSEVLERRSTYPEVHEFLGEVSLWNFMVDGAHAEYEQAEQQFKKVNRPIPEMVAFFDRVIESFASAKDKQVAKAAQKMVDDWKKKKTEYLGSAEVMQ